MKENNAKQNSLKKYEQNERIYIVYCQLGLMLVRVENYILQV